MNYKMHSHDLTGVWTIAVIGLIIFVLSHKYTSTQIAGNIIIGGNFDLIVLPTDAYLL